MKHHITVRAEKTHINTPALTAHIKRCVRETLNLERVSAPCEINVLLTDNAGIRGLNRMYRNIDRETDVLSFPMFTFLPGDFPDDVTELLDPGESLLPLGDMAISIEKAYAQAKEFGHSVEREVGYLTVHSVLHLLGYDHMDEGDRKRQMRGREDAVMQALDIPRCLRC